MALAETKPALRSFRIVEAKALARASDACLWHSPLLLLPFVTTPRRVSTLATVVRCHLPPRLVGTALRFNSFASAAWDTNPAAISFRRVEAKARARESGPAGPLKHRVSRSCGTTLARVMYSSGHHGRISMASARQRISVKIVSC
jgi:hypothetical protein